MTDIPFRVYGPAGLNGGLGSTLYTAPAGTSKFFIKDITLTLVGSTTTRVRMTIGNISDTSKRVVDNDVTTANSPLMLRPLWLMDAEETFQALQVLNQSFSMTEAAVGASGTDGTSQATAAWIPAANTMYLLFTISGAASGTAAVAPTSFAGNGTWTQIGQVSSTVASAVNVNVSAWFWYSSAAGSSATTTATWPSTQHSFAVSIQSITNTFAGDVAYPPFTTTATPAAQAVTAADSVAPGSSSNSLVVTLGALETGRVLYWTARAGDTPTVTPPASFTEQREVSVGDASGSVASFAGELSYVTTPPWVSTAVGPATYSGASTGARASIAFEIIPSTTVNCMVSGIEVH